MNLTLLPKTDEELIRRAKSQDARAFRELMNRYLKIVYSFVYRMVNQSELAEDMTQEIFVKVYQNLGSFDSARPFKPWLMRIASNHTLSALRKKANQVVSLDALQDDQPAREWAGTVDRGSQPEEIIERQDKTARVALAIQEMDPNYRQALLLRFQHDLSYEEIAGAMKVPVNTVRTWLKRGRDKLKQKIQQQYEEGLS